MLTTHVKNDRVLLNFEAKGYEQALMKMLVLSERKNHAEIIAQVMKRESLMPTALGRGVALPRIILDDQMKTEMIIAISQHGVNLNGFDHLPVKIILLCLFSKNDDYASILAQCLRLLNDDSLRTELLTAKTEDEVVKLVKMWEEE